MTEKEIEKLISYSDFGAYDVSIFYTSLDIAMEQLSKDNPYKCTESELRNLALSFMLTNQVQEVKSLLKALLEK